MKYYIISYCKSTCKNINIDYRPVTATYDIKGMKPGYENSLFDDYIIHILSSVSLVSYMV